MQPGGPILMSGLGLCLVSIGLTALSFAFPYGIAISDAPLTLYVGLAMLAGVLWVIVAQQISRLDGALPSVFAIVMVGLFLRAVMFVSLPVLEDDSYRYLWDGAVTAQGIDPYKYAPAEISPPPLLGEQKFAHDDPNGARLAALAEKNSEAHSRINFPYIATIYPPLAQAAFAVAHWIDPFGLTGWRTVLLAADLLTLVLLSRLLRAFQRDPTWLCLYWWNPVVILQGFGAGHMDVLVLPFLVGAVLLAKHQRYALAILALAGGAAIKLWPVLLLPILVRPLLRQPIRLVLVSALFSACLIVLLFPQLTQTLRPEAGLNAYASEWRTHAFLFSILEDGVFSGLDSPGQFARFSVAAIMLSLTAYLALKFADCAERLPSLIACVIAILIFLSPTGYPWYFIWLAPFVPFVPSAGMLSLFLLAPLYWLRFQLGDASPVYQWLVVPIAFGVPLLFFARRHFPRSIFDAIHHHHPRTE